jgi:hypothetical protein
MTGGYVKTYVIDVDMSRTPDEGAHSPTWSNGLILLVLTAISPLPWQSKLKQSRIAHPSFLCLANQMPAHGNIPSVWPIERRLTGIFPLCGQSNAGSLGYSLSVANRMRAP